MHRTLFRTVSLLAPSRQGEILGRYFDWWHRSPDPWRLSTDSYEREKYAATLADLPARPYRDIVEVGCAEGVFTQALAETFPEAEITGLDISGRALARARARVREERVRFVRANILTHRADRRFDLAFCAETLYYLGREERLRRASDRLGDLLAPGGVLVAVHPWPEAGRLHRYLDARAGLTRLSERVHRNPQRPFTVAVYRA
ncbi:class I SAM-dependent methyltransferase [Bailinhaonella thermotolerans]|nr:SAM-dependent methyltransferase [Bailinhaonella thermotolerans]